ncbi:hypothetical protein [Almyronema epifaneia]|uniref:hypothetical protein n=1 Tax=Almyronema epifaneia TaxID=3114805 RepID=UPI00366FB3D7
MASQRRLTPILQKKGTDETDETDAEPRLFNPKSKIQNPKLIVTAWFMAGLWKNGSFGLGHQQANNAAASSVLR